jgi:hypothetical protein
MFESNRGFQLWEYRVSHQQLLIRSPSTPEIDTNVDLIFRGVAFLNAPTTFSGIKICKRSGGAYPSYGKSSFELHTEGRVFEIVALSCKVLEHELDIFESTLDFFTGEKQVTRELYRF